MCVNHFWAFGPTTEEHHLLPSPKQKVHINYLAETKEHREGSITGFWRFISRKKIKWINKYGTLSIVWQSLHSYMVRYYLLAFPTSCVPILPSSPFSKKKRRKKRAFLLLVTLDTWTWDEIGGLLLFLLWKTVLAAQVVWINQGRRHPLYGFYYFLALGACQHESFWQTVS